MKRLSSPVEQIKSHYSIIVIGSGYGGSIAASRFARAGKDVCLLERGKEFLPGEYPDTEAQVARESQFDLQGLHMGAETALMDFRFNKDINVLLGCGLGGTSLINAGVAVMPDKRVFDDPVWPSTLRQDRTGFEEGVEHAETMLAPKAYPDFCPPLAKIAALRKSSEAVDGTKFYQLPINVTFEDRTNEAGLFQPACVGCGDCVTGCNYGSKNTTLMNYLHDAHNHGAEIFTRVSVRYLERKDGKWLVHYQLAAAGRDKFDSPPMFVSADMIVLAAGTLGSTEILLRSRRAAGLDLSGKLGQKFTGNGDALGFSYNADVEVNGTGFGPNSPEGRAPVGPCITSVLDGRDTTKLEDGYVIEEGTLPGALANLVRIPFSAAAGLMGTDTDRSVADAVKEKSRELESLVRGPYKGAMRNTQTYLVMAHDDGAGEMILDDDKDRLRVDWPGVGTQPIFEKVNDRLLDATKPLGGTYLPNPTWTELTNHSLTTVHPLGGCVMAEQAEDGVVNHKGQVFSSASGDRVYQDLIVCDGSIVPRPLGINPLLTISALAERSCALIAADRGWSIDYTIRPVAQPAAGAALPVGVRFTETMKGYFSRSVTDDFKQGAETGKADGSSFKFILTITSEDAETMLAEPGHNSRAVGTVEAPALSDQPLTVNDGIFQLFVKDPDRVETRNMVYKLPLTAEDGSTYAMHGVKLVHSDRGMLDMWDDTTTLFITIHEGDLSGSVIGKGILRIEIADFAVQLQTMQVLNATDRKQQLEMLARYGGFFGQELFNTYGGVMARENRMDATAPTIRKRRPLRMRPPAVHPVTTSDGTEIRLTRYQGGTKGPVILSPGFGVSTMSFSTDTIDTNLPEFLYAYGYDIWLLDYRASPDLPSSANLFSLDDIAQQDYPAAVARVRAETGAETVQVIAHCIGSMTFQMAMLSGLEGVRSAICSQLDLFPKTSTANEIKTGLRMGHFLAALGGTSVDMNLPLNDWRNKLAEAVALMGPREELCQSSVCHQVRMIIGESYAHDQLNAATHDALHEMFGLTNLKTFNHIALTIEKGQVVDVDGNDIYLPHIERLKIPISFIQGARNTLFYPENTQKTFRHLCEKNGPDNYIHIQFPDYAHMDCFVGKTAVDDIFPTLYGELDKFPADAAAPARRGRGAGQ